MKLDMNLLKKVFPYSFGIKDTTSLIIGLVLHVVAAVVIDLVLGLIGTILAFVPVLNIIFGIVAWVVGGVATLYLVVGAVLMLLDYFKVLK